jgi:hypothetical protein
MFNIAYSCLVGCHILTVKKTRPIKNVYLLFHLTDVFGRIPTLFHFAVNRVRAFYFNVLLLLCFYTTSLKKIMEMRVFSSQTRITRNKHCVHCTF